MGGFRAEEVVIQLDEGRTGLRLCKEENWRAGRNQLARLLRVAARGRLTIGRGVEKRVFAPTAPLRSRLGKCSIAKGIASFFMSISGMRAAMRNRMKSCRTSE